ncbi:MAG: GDSL-type esterase/lipase family protein [Aquabacterium sp.]
MSAAAAAGHWVTVWAASAQGAYPVGSTIAQPNLSGALPDAARGLVNQSLRMLLRPGLWASRFRLRLSNHFGDRPLQLRGMNLGLHVGGGGLLPGTRVAMPDQVVAAGSSAWTPAVEWAAPPAAPQGLPGRHLAFSAWVDGASGPITWHAKAMATSYLSQPGDRAAAGSDSELGFPHTTTSTFLVDALDAWLPAGVHALAAFGDSLTDGTATTLNGHDRWTDVLQRELWAAGRRDLAVVNAGIGGNQVAGPAPGTGAWRGGPPAIERMRRDVLSLSGVSTVFWLQGINDFSDNGQAEAAVVIDAMTSAVRHFRARGLRVIGATVPSALGSTRPGHGGALQDARRRAFNAEVRRCELFDHVVDLDHALTDPHTGALHAAFNGDSTAGEPGDGVHPNRAGHAAMARCILQNLP